MSESMYSYTSVPVGGDGEAEDPPAADDTEEMRAQLEQKDKDLMLAAELGKALLEKNSELERKLEQSTEEYNQRIEELKQERYGLHLRLENVQGEYEAAVKELQYDVTQLSEQLERARRHNSTDERASSRKLQTVTQQSERLIEELAAARAREQELTATVHSLRESTQPALAARHAAQVDILQDKVFSLTEGRRTAERQLERVTEEREAAVSALEETQDRVRVLERRRQELEEQLERKDAEVRELTERNEHLLGQVDSLTEKASNSSGHSMTLFTELAQLSGNNEVAMATDSPINQYPPSMFGEDDVECDDDDVDFVMTSHSPTQHVDRSFGEDARQRYRPNRQKDADMEAEILQAYHKLRHICREIRQQMGERCGESGEEEEVSTGSADTDSLNDVVEELQVTVRGAIERANQTQAGQLEEMGRLQGRVEQLEADLTSCRASLDNIRHQMDARDIHLQQKNFKITELSHQVTSQHEDIRVLSSQRDRLQELMAPDAAKPQAYSAMALLRHARRERDAAIERKYSLEKELQAARYETIVLNHQLLEAVHQKNKVSQLLDQWQSDMANLLGVKMELGAHSKALSEIGLAKKQKEKDENNT
ncbi:BICD family-like cargo adapter 1 [Mya arenaria]|uniref:BICD family-like cargo adapter 1 n=1 Tax=Mya arenaria TaxID=6604 RepID=UPI0022E2B6AA|nr:BICD family-like cargo adapter 1 [Mya arenaria]